MARRDLLALVALLLLALGLRLHDVSSPPARWMDENAHLPAAQHYWSAGQFEPDFWEHPPLRHLLAYAFLEAFGDGPLGWRLRNVLLGAAAAALTWLLAFHASGSRRTALLAGALVATDPLHVVTSRFTFDEVYGTTFFLAAVVVFVTRRRQAAWLFLAALLMGCALATKWYYLPGWLLLLILSLLEEGRFRDPRASLHLAGTWLLVPLAVYLASYYPWFGRGYGLGELARLTLDAYRSLQSLTVAEFQAIDRRTFFHAQLSAVDWFLRPVMVGQGTFGADRGEFILFGNNLPAWGLTLPAVLGTAVVAARRRRWVLALPALLFAATYALFVVVDRPVFIYSAIPLVPFALSAVAQGVTLLADRLDARLFWVTAVLLVGWSLFLYPLVTAQDVPLAPYRLVLEQAVVQPR